MELIARLTGLSGPNLYYECRVCGRTLDRDPGSCPRCDGGVAVYDF